MYCTSVGDVYYLQIWRETDPIGAGESFCYGSAAVRLGIIPIDLIGKLRLVADSLVIAVARVSEPYAAIVGVDYDIIDAVEGCVVECGNDGRTHDAVILSRHNNETR